MEKNVESINDIITTIEQLILENHNQQNNDMCFSNNDSLCDNLDSLALCLLIVSLEEIYHISFPIELFSKDDTVKSLADKIYGLLKN